MRLQQFFSLLFVLTVFSTSTLFSKIEHWDTFEDEDISEYYTKSEIPEMIIARPESIKGRAINVYVDGEYVTSLLPGAYTVELVCPGKHRIKLAYTNVLTRYKEKQQGGQYFTFKPKKKYHFRILKKGKSLLVKPLTSKEIEELKDHYTKKQHHTISRLSKRKCIKRVKKSTNVGKGK